MSQNSATFIAIAKQLHSQLPALVGDAAPELNEQLSGLLTQAEQNPQDPTIGNQIRFLFLDYPQVSQWLNERMYEQQGEEARTPKGVPSYGATRGFQHLPGAGIPVPTTDPTEMDSESQFICPVCKDENPWTRMYKDEQPEDCDRHEFPVKRVPKKKD